MSKNIIWYINEFKDVSFIEKKLNIIDYLLFSELTYLDYKGILNNNSEDVLLGDIIDKLILNNKYGDFTARNGSIEIIKELKDSNRYKDVILSNYLYKIGEDYQFGAFTIKANNECIVCFEGTDNVLSGWLEDFALTYEFQTPAQKLATAYLKETLKKYNNIIVCGHSKGGNLAVGGCLKLSFINKCKIKKIYSFDGPGILDKEFNSFNYKLIRRKLVNIIPSVSVFGVMFNHENFITIESDEKGIMQHSALSWQVDENNFIKSKRDKISINIENGMKSWLLDFNDYDRLKLHNILINLFKNNDIKYLQDLGKDKIWYVINLIKTTNKLDIEDKKLLLGCIHSFLKVLSNEIINDKRNDLKSSILEIEDSIKDIVNKLK